jgi:hypothetical protein
VWDLLDRQERSGISRDRREHLAAAKLYTFGRAAALRARAVNELFTILRWAREDAPGDLAWSIREAVLSVVEPDLEALAQAALRTRRAG